MLGTILNVVGILAGGIIGLTRRKPLSAKQEQFLKVLLGAFTVFYGLRITVMSLNGPFSHILKQLCIVVLSLMAGRVMGRLLRLQKFSNQLGQMAKQTMATPGGPGERRGAGFRVCAALFCAAPLGILGAVQDGLTSDFHPLAVKGVMDGLATMGLVSLFGWSALLSALPVLAFQGSISLFCNHIAVPYLSAHEMLNSVNAVCGLLIFAVALVILQIKRIELADYLPSLIFAPIFAWIWP